MKSGIKSDSESMFRIDVNRGFDVDFDADCEFDCEMLKIDDSKSEMLSIASPIGLAAGPISTPKSLEQGGRPKWSVLR